MKELTRAEDEIMQIIWKINRGFVKDILEEMPEPRPAYNTVSTIVRILVQKEFLGYEAFGKTHRYYPLISKDEYSSLYLRNFVRQYFGNSYKRLLSFMAKDNSLSVADIDVLMKRIKSEKKNPKKKSK